MEYVCCRGLCEYWDMLVVVLIGGCESMVHVLLGGVVFGSGVFIVGGVGYF